VWERDGFNVVVAGDAHEQRPVGTGPAMDFLAGKLMGRAGTTRNPMGNARVGSNPASPLYLLAAVNGFFKAMIDTQHANVDGGS
jgi:hypothetical protein